jgi:3-methyladenine DNA glycosylase AlkD
MNDQEVLKRLRALGKPGTADEMARVGIQAEQALGVPVPRLRELAKQIGADHQLAMQLWSSGIHEARILASMIDDPRQVTEQQMDRWAADFDSWDICDQCCGNLFDRTPYAYTKAIAWSAREEEFVKRAAFALMAYLAVHDKRARNDAFEVFLPLIAREAGDSRNFVKKASSWALRQIGKRNAWLGERAIETAHIIQQQESSAARWVAADVLRELTGDKQQRRFRR